MRKVIFIQPLLTSYRIPLFAELSKYWRLIVVCSPIDKVLGFGNHAESIITELDCRELPKISPFGSKVGMYQIGISKLIRRERPDAVIIFANLRFLSFWTTLIECKLRGISVFPHGHGLNRKIKPGILWRIVYWFVLKLSSAYICYTPSVAASLRKEGLPENKIAVADNSLSNAFPIRPDQKTGNEHGILFIGRLRSGSHLEILISTLKRLHNTGYSSITLHIIGDGPQVEQIRQVAKGADWIHIHGEIYSQEQISRISKECMIGCYPGNAGLSIVHMMSLSLPPVTHDDLNAHEGPEPSYIHSGRNGILFDRNNSEEDLVKALQSILDHPDQLKELQDNAYNTYMQLINPSLAMRFVNIVGK